MRQSFLLILAATTTTVTTASAAVEGTILSRGRFVGIFLGHLIMLRKFNCSKGSVARYELTAHSAVAPLQIYTMVLVCI